MQQEMIEICGAKARKGVVHGAELVEAFDTGRIAMGKGWRWSERAGREVVVRREGEGMLQW